jgi:hypothetical protein
MTSPKLNNSTKNTSDSEVERISKNFLKIIIRMMNEIKENMNKCLNEF